MIKLIGCILILFSTTSIGFIFADNFKQRTIQLMELQRSINQLENEIVYTHTPLPEAFNSLSVKGKQPLSQLFREISELLYSNSVDSVYEAFKIKIKENEKKFNLSKEDYSILFDLSKTLGESDIDGQKKIFNLTKLNLDKELKVAEENKMRYMKMYRSLGVTLGLMIIIVLF